MYDGLSVKQLTDNDYNEYNPKISGSNVVWNGKPDGNDYEVFLYDGSSITQITDNDYWEQSPEVSGSNVVWHADPDGNDAEIFLYDGSSITQITDNDRSDWVPKISGMTVAWQHDDGHDTEIFMVTIPEPTTLSLLALGGMVLIRWGKASR